MTARRILGMKVLPGRALAWPLFFAALPSYVVGLVAIAMGSRSWVSAQPLFYRACKFLAQPPVVWVLGGIYVAVDLLLIYWAGRELRRAREAARPVRLFFLWQVAKLSHALVYFALAYAYRLP